jgi:hypothetical protein
MMDALRAVIDKVLDSQGRHGQRVTCVAQQQEVLPTVVVVGWASPTTIVTNHIQHRPSTVAGTDFTQAMFFEK